MRGVLLALLPSFLLGCSSEPALLRQAREAALATALSRAFLQSLEAEKSAVLAVTDEESVRFAEESRRSAQEVDRLLRELRALLDDGGRPAERARLQAFTAAWAQVTAIDARLLPLAVANTNLKAARLSTHEAAAALERLLTALTALQARAREPARLRTLAAASVAALTIQTLHPPHIASPDDAEMTTLEARIGALAATVNEVLGAEDAGALRDGAQTAWREYQGHTAEVLRLSRENTNVISVSMSLHEKRDASMAAELALQALVAEVQAPGPRATR
jgi:hypothetical protein